MVRPEGYPSTIPARESIPTLQMAIQKPEPYSLQISLRANALPAPTTNLLQRANQITKALMWAMIVEICWRTLLASGKSSATYGFLCAIKGHRVSGGIRAAVAQKTVASAKRIVWDSLLRKTMANTKERIDALEAQVQRIVKCDEDAPGILKQISLRLDALEVNVEATDNARYAESMDWEGNDMSAVDRLFFFMEGLKPWARTELNRRRVNNLNEAIIAADTLSAYNSEPPRPPQRGNPKRSNGGKKPGGLAPSDSWGSTNSWASNSSTLQKSGVGFKAKPDASTSGEVKKPAFRGCFLCQGPHVIANCPQRQMMNAFFDNMGQVQRGEQSGSQSRHPPTEEQTDTQDYEEEDAVGAFPQWCNAVTTQVGNPEESSTGEKLKDMPPKKKSDVPGKGLMYVDIKVNGKAIRAMVDTGATHNYISSTEVERLGLTLEKGCGRVKAINSAAQPVAGWQELLAEFNFMLEYRAGSTNSVADALSRRAELNQVALMAMNAIVRADSRVAINIGQKIKKALTRDPVAQQLLKLIESGKSAFEIVNGQQPLLPHTVNVPNAGKSPRAISFSEEWMQNIDLAHSYLEKAARRMKKHADKNRRSQEFNVGDKVMVKLLPQDRKFLRGRDSRLLQKYEGPLIIVKKIGKMAYKVDPPNLWSRQLHPVFHVSMLKPFYEDTADPSRGQIRRPGLKPKAAGKRVAEAILNDRVITASRKRHQEYLVKWQGYMDEENTWERAADLSAYTDKIEAYHMQKLTRTSTALVGENVTGCPLHPPSTAPPHPSCTAPPRPSNMHPCALTSSSREYKVAVFESMKTEETDNSLVFHTRELDSFDEQVDRDQVTETPSKNIDDVHENAVERIEEGGSDAPTCNLI
ncbi:hypothetical protein RJ640_025114 [Escallonia rubra]|uniref:Chromo domain-containing protein n=1 Tax=Escallonia rubra TaxID=112253 RepID=A0AA88S427_9ASTE|nr:hypothetical protein RJ640_025114 [Escallonia rubra]